MADIPSNGKIRIAFAASVSNKAAPTVAELNAALNLTLLVTRDGLMGFEPDTGEVDNSHIASEFDTKTVGTDAYSGTALRLKKQSGSDTAYATLIKEATGFIVIRRDLHHSVAWTAGQAVEVYPVTIGRRKRLSPEKDTVTRYDIPTMISDEPNLDAVVAA